ncbi:hypothetical protein NQ314_011478 [Rhamnusium bicolor]|uniref:inositol-phosphate phosphatase n=1 Tax=Rhamnusium bicolor TaxID=1586634 RepID=A0AAV8XKC1_9CUCU|nr:hypothetical protein NQ314_011478 [Rhamnusium bicolor]
MNLGRVIHLNKAGVCTLCGLLCILFLYTVTRKSENMTKPIKLSKINLGRLLDVVIKAAENGGKEVIQTKDNIEIKSKGRTKEGLVDSVTTADFLSHCSMIKTLKHFYPSIKVISEEANTKCNKNQSINYFLHELGLKNLSEEYVDEKDITVWIDPLDATHEYTGRKII